MWPSRVPQAAGPDSASNGKGSASNPVEVAELYTWPPIRINEPKHHCVRVPLGIRSARGWLCGNPPLTVDDFKRTTADHRRDALRHRRARLDQDEHQEHEIDDREDSRESLELHRIPPDTSLPLTSPF